MTRPSRFPFIEHVGLVFEEHRAGFSKCTLQVEPQHFNSSGVVHGGVVFTMADTGMGAALLSELKEGEKCATIEIKINYFRPVVAGVITCTTQLVHRGKSVAHLESSVQVEGHLVARASGNFAIFKPRASSTS
jgi:acyl-CoA thioesterase